MYFFTVKLTCIKLRGILRSNLEQLEVYKPRNKVYSESIFYVNRDNRNRGSSNLELCAFLCSLVLFRLRRNVPPPWCIDCMSAKLLRVGPAVSLALEHCVAPRPCSFAGNVNVGCLNLAALEVFSKIQYLWREKVKVNVYCIKLNSHLFLSYSIF